jgi:hypothetical protein
MNIIKDTQTINNLKKKYKLSFCPKYKYYDGDTYTNTKGETLPMYFSLGAKIYQLKYVDGCFNPFLIDVTNVINKKISEAQSRSFMGKNQIDKDRANNYAEYLLSLFN